MTANEDASSISTTRRTAIKGLALAGSSGLAGLTAAQTTGGPVAAFDYHPSEVTSGDEVTFDASASEGDVVAYDWTVKSWARGTDGGRSVTETASGVQLTYEMYASAGYSVTLEVEDASGATDSTSVSIYPEYDAEAEIDLDPRADGIADGDEVTLDASGSTAGEGDIVDFQWAIQSWPVDNPTKSITEYREGEQSSFTAYAGVDYRVTLTVTDEGGNEAQATERFVVDEVDFLVDGQYVPQDVNGDGLYRDVTGDGSVTNSDVNVFFQNQHVDPIDSRPDLFDYNGDGDVTQSDVTTLYDYVAGQ